MNMQSPATPKNPGGFAEFDSLHRPAYENAFGGAASCSHPKPAAQRATIAAAGITAIIVVAVTLVSAPVDRSDTPIPQDSSTLDDRIRHNVEALRHSREWWESYGQREAARAQRKRDRKD